MHFDKTKHVFAFLQQFATAHATAKTSKIMSRLEIIIKSLAVERSDALLLGKTVHICFFPYVPVAHTHEELLSFSLLVAGVMLTYASYSLASARSPMRPS